MALFGLFKSKEEKELDALVKRPLEMIFPMGEEDLRRDSQRIGVIVKGKLQGEELRGFVRGCKTVVALAGMSGDVARDDEGFIQSILHRCNHRISESEARDVYVYLAGESMYRVNLCSHHKGSGSAIPQHLIDYADSMADIWGQGSTRDHIPGGYGEYGYTATNPIPTVCVKGSETYLSRLRYNGKPVEHHRLGSTGSEVTAGKIDIYELSLAGEKLCSIYICPYHRKDSKVPPKGYSMAISD